MSDSCCGGIFKPSACQVQAVTGTMCLLGFVALFRHAILGESVQDQLKVFPIFGKEPLDEKTSNAFLATVAFVALIRVVFVLRPYDKALTQINVVASALQAFVVSYLFYTNIFLPCCVKNAGGEGVLGAITSVCFLKKFAFLATFYFNLVVQMRFWHAREEGTIRSDESVRSNRSQQRAASVASEEEKPKPKAKSASKKRKN